MSKCPPLYQVLRELRDRGFSLDLHIPGVVQGIPDYYSNAKIRLEYEHKGRITLARKREVPIHTAKLKNKPDEAFDVLVASLYDMAMDIEMHLEEQNPPDERKVLDMQGRPFVTIGDAIEGEKPVVTPKDDEGKTTKPVLKDEDEDEKEDAE